MRPPQWFNRTFMELKFDIYMLSICYQLIISIIRSKR